MRRLLNFLAAVGAGLAIWVSGGVLAVAGGDMPSARVGLLPPWWALVAALVAAPILLAGLRRAQLSAWPLCVSGLLLLPWIPVGVPAAWLIWTGPAVVVVWLVIVAGLLASRRWPAAATLAPLVRDPVRAPVLAALLSALVYMIAAWGAAPMAPGGDEPHYLIITQSLLHDFDLKIENNHRQRDFQAYLDLSELKPDFLQRSTTGEIYSIHPPGISFLVAPAFALAGYRGVEIFLVLLAAIGAGFAWAFAWRLAGDAAAAWFGWAATTLSTTYVFHAFTVYPDGVGGLAVLAGVWMLVRLDRDEAAPPVRALVLTGAALAALPWLHSRFALLAGPLGLFIALRLVQRVSWRHARRPVAMFLAAPAASALVWFGYFYAIYGTPNPQAPYGSLLRLQSSLDFVPSGLAGLLFDQQFGLLPYSPALVAALVGLAGMLVWGRRERRLALELVATMAPYLLSVTYLRMWWAGWSAPARFFDPLLPVLAAPAALVWLKSRHAATRAALGWALACTVATTLALAWIERGRLAYNVRDGYSLWFEWLSPLADLPRGLPSFFRTTEGESYAHVAIWLGAIAAAWLVLRFGGRARIGAGVLRSTVVPIVFLLAGMTAATFVWRVTGTAGVTAPLAQLTLLRAAGGTQDVGLSYRPFGLLPGPAVASKLAIDSPPRYLETSERLMFVAPGIPAGAYRLRVDTAPQPAGVVRIGVAQEDLLVQQAALAEVAPSGVGWIELSFPVDVRAIVARGDEAARAAVRRMVLEPVSVVAPRDKAAAGTAWRAVTYPGGTVYFLDEGALPEPNAFWVRGEAAARVVLAPSAARPDTISLFVRNAPVANTLTVTAGDWQDIIKLVAGEERRLSIPLMPGARATLVRFHAATGFRPSEVEPGSLDARFLGVWVAWPR